MELLTKALETHGLTGLLTASLIFMYWHHVTKTIPSLLDTFKGEQEAERGLFRETLEKYRRDCDEKHQRLSDDLRKSLLTPRRRGQSGDTGDTAA